MRYRPTILLALSVHVMGSMVPMSMVRCVRHDGRAQIKLAVGVCDCCLQSEQRREAVEHERTTAGKNKQTHFCCRHCAEVARERAASAKRVHSHLAVASSHCCKDTPIESLPQISAGAGDRTAQAVCQFDGPPSLSLVGAVSSDCTSSDVNWPYLTSHLRPHCAQLEALAAVILRC